ncbi:MAG TPA: GGDEF domain-containing protein [Pseudolabrys sp.]|nr:GGDEF domain-containing protein [Pseudolabrys sp.]
MPDPQFELSFLDGPTLAFVTVCIVALLGLFLVLAWLQQRDMRALAWWGAAYLIGASSLALWAAPHQWIHLPREVPFAMIFVACGMVWNGVRLFRGRPLLPVGAFAGAAVWLLLCQLPLFAEGTMPRAVLGILVVAAYTFSIAFELWRERRKSVHSRIAQIVVPCLHAAIFLLPLAILSLMPEVYAASWLTVFTLETILYAVGTAFMVLLMVKDHAVDIYRDAASTDFLTGLLNRRAFLENALRLCAKQAKNGKPVTLMMFDLDHFKSINDRFGHNVGDEALRAFADTIRKSMRGSDIIGRLGGEEFAAIVDEPGDVAAMIAERVRAGFETAGVEIAGIKIGATVSIGAATATEVVTNIDALIARADVALYRAKGEGRNRLRMAETEPPVDRARLIAAARSSREAEVKDMLRRNSAA